MWFFILSVLALVAIMGTALISDLCRRAKLRRMNEPLLGSGPDTAAQRGRADVDIRRDHMHSRSTDDYGFGGGGASG